MNWPQPNGSTCPACGKPALKISSESIEEKVAGRTYSIDGLEYNQCEACGETFFLGGQADEISRRLNEMARGDLGRLGGAEIVALRLELGLTQSQLERRLGVSVGLVGRWEREAVLQSAMADRYLRDLKAHPELAMQGDLVARESRGPYHKKT